MHLHLPVNLATKVAFAFAALGALLGAILADVDLLSRNQAAHQSITQRR